MGIMNQTIDRIRNLVELLSRAPAAAEKATSRRGVDRIEDAIGRASDDLEEAFSEIKEILNEARDAVDKANSRLDRVVEEKLERLLDAQLEAGK
jgi:hypothetical protein